MDKSEFARMIAEVMEGRGKTHGDFFNHTAKLWNAYLELDGVISGIDVCQMMVLQKMSRAKGGDAGHFDHYLDEMGYAACAGELATENSVIDQDPLTKSESG